MQTVDERFWAKVDVSGPDDCWPWTACRLPKGYGRFRVAGVTVLANRMAWQLTHGAPGALWVLHRCDNPPCCNPAHLFLGTNADNVADRVAKGRTGDRRGERNSQARLTAGQVEEIRGRYKKGLGAALAREFGITRTHVRDIALGRAWAR